MTLRHSGLETKVQSSVLSFLLQSPQTSNSELEALGKQIIFKLLKGLEMLLPDRHLEKASSFSRMGREALFSPLGPQEEREEERKTRFY